MGKDNELKVQKKSSFESSEFVVVKEEESLNLNALKGGLDFYLNGGKDEVTSVKKRLKNLQSKHLSSEDIARLDLIEQPPKPTFQTKTLAQVRSMWSLSRKSYKKKMDAFEKRRRDWDNSPAGRKWKKTLSEILDAPVEQIYPEDSITLDKIKLIDEDAESVIKKVKKGDKNKDIKNKKNKSNKELDYSKLDTIDLLNLDNNQLDEFIEFKTKECDYQPIEEDPDAMDEMLIKEESQEFVKQEALISKGEICKAHNAHPAGQFAVDQYISSTRYCTIMNNYYRNGQKSSKLYENWAKDAHKMLSTTKLSRDLVSKRAVDSFKTIAYMLGLEDPENMTDREIQEALQDRIDSGEDVILHEKGFCSTSVSREGYHAAAIEFVILNKKGTSGINYTANGSRGGENELLLDAGTKFKVIKAYFNSSDPEDQRKPFAGDEGVWKIYLVTIPGANEVTEA